jgi:mono/diheme cytochrome c family protein
MPKNRKPGLGLRRWLRATPLIAMAVGLLGCMSLEQMAPPVDQNLVQLSAESNVLARADEATLARGRHVFINRCISCHSLEPVNRYSVEQWKTILPEMAEEANLSEDQQADLLAYVLTARQYIDLYPQGTKP